MQKKQAKKTLKKSLDNVQFIYLLSALVFFVAFLLFLWFIYQYISHAPQGRHIGNPKQSVFEVEDSALCKHMRLLDGVCVKSESKIDSRLVGVMIDNHMGARPPSGLADAHVVYEAPVEGNFTRFLAIYTSDTDVSKVGPVRSARPYFLDWVSEFNDPLYIHIGGSATALERIREYNIFDVDEFYNDWYIWRDNNRSAPHNAYASSKLWRKAIADYEESNKEMKEENNQATHWTFDMSEPCTDACVDKVTVTFALPSFRVVWEYSTSTEEYVRYQAGQKHTDFDGTQIVADTVIVQNVETIVLDGVGRLGMETIGEGEVIIFRGGNSVLGTWKKEDRTHRTMWFDENGEEIALRAGKIWVEVVNQRGKVTY